MRIKARATFDPTAQAEFNVPKGQGFLTIQIYADYRAKMGEEVAKIRKRQQNKLDEALDRWNSTPPAERGPKPVYRDFLVDLELDLTIHYRRRTVDQNALLWSLYTIEANYLNNTPAYRNGYWSQRLPGHIITPQEIHDDDVEIYSERQRYMIFRKDKFMFSRAMELGEMGRVMNERDVDGQPEKIAVDVVKTTSFLTTKEMAEWSKRVMDRIIENGLLRSDEAQFIGLKQDLQDIIKGAKKKN